MAPGRTDPTVAPSRRRRRAARAGDAAGSTAAAPPRSRKSESWVETVKTVVYALLIALVIRTFLFQPFNIPSGSMENTLADRRLSVRREIRLWLQPLFLPLRPGPVLAGASSASAPKRGDVVVFKLPRDTSTDYIKRVIGLPGDRIQMINDRLYINDKIVPRDARRRIMSRTSTAIEHHVPQYRETLPSGKSLSDVLDRDPDGPADNTDVYRRAARPLFHDGRQSRQFRRQPRRTWATFRPQNLVGKAEFIFFSTNGSAHSGNSGNGRGRSAMTRLFTVID